MEAIQKAGHSGKVDVGLDVASSEFYNSKNKTYDVSQKSGKGDRVLTPEKLVELYSSLCDKFPIKSIEDPFD